MITEDGNELLSIRNRYTIEDVIIVDKNGNVVKNKEGISDDGKLKKGYKIAEIEAKQHFVTYKFLPSPDSGFFGIGYGHLLYESNLTLNALANMILDAGMLANSSVIFADSTLAGNEDIKLDIENMIKNGGVQVNIVDTQNFMDRNLASLMTTVNFKEPSQALINFFQFYLQMSEATIGITSQTENIVQANTAPTTALALVNENTKVIRNSYRRLYDSLKKEIMIIEDIISRDVDGVYKDMYENVFSYKGSSFKNDFQENGDIQVTPVTDPSQMTSVDKMARVQFELSLLESPATSPYMDGFNVVKDAYNALGMDWTSKISRPAPQENIQEKVLQVVQMSEAMKAQLQKMEEDRLRFEAMMKAQRQDEENKNTRADTIQKLASAISDLKKSDLDIRNNAIQNLERLEQVLNNGTREAKVTEEETEELK